MNETKKTINKLLRKTMIVLCLNLFVKLFINGIIVLLSAVLLVSILNPFVYVANVDTMSVYGVIFVTAYAVLSALLRKPDTQELAIALDSLLFRHNEASAYIELSKSAKTTPFLDAIGRRCESTLSTASTASIPRLNLPFKSFAIIPLALCIFITNRYSIQNAGMPYEVNILKSALEMVLSDTEPVEQDELKHELQTLLDNAGAFSKKEIAERAEKIARRANSLAKLGELAEEISVQLSPDDHGKRKFASIDSSFLTRLSEPVRNNIMELIRQNEALLLETTELASDTNRLLSNSDIESLARLLNSIGDILKDANPITMRRIEARMDIVRKMSGEQRGQQGLEGIVKYAGRSSATSQKLSVEYDNGLSYNAGIADSGWDEFEYDSRVNQTLAEVPRRYGEVVRKYFLK